jgi:4-amino-4-deoxy-L-arabinose transferase-like glycosyltransferase
MTHDETRTPWTTDLLILVFFFGALMLFALGRLPLANPDEARYAEIAREMAVNGDWVTPRLNDIPYFEKPPLVYWTVRLSRAMFGPGEFATRLTPALFGLGGILLTYAAGRRLFGREAGLAAAVVLGTSLLYFVLSRILLLDMAVSVLMSATLFSFILGIREPSGTRRRGFFYALYASAALATLTKGLIGFLIPGAVMFLWLLVFKQWRRLRPLYLPSGVALFLAIAAPWHLLAAARNPDWANFYFVREHWERFFSTTHYRAEPIWFFLPVVAVGLFPWSGFLAGAIRTAVAGGWARRNENADAWFLITWAAFVLIFFSSSESKLIPYILPLFPPLAVLIGAWIARCWAERAASRLRIGFSIFAFACGVLGVAFFAAVMKPGLIRDPEQALVLRPFGIALGVALLLGGVAAPWAAKMRGVAAGLGTMIATMIGFFLVLLVAAPDFQRAGTKDLALVARVRMAPHDRVYHYWAFFHDFVYYAECPVGLVSYIDELEVQFLSAEEKAARFIDDAELRRQWSGPERLWLVVRKRDQQHAESVFADPAFRHFVIAETRAHRLLSNRP